MLLHGLYCFLHRLCFFQCCDCFKPVFLLKHIQNGQTPLMLAAEQGSLEIIQELIRRGANVNLDDVVSALSVALFSVLLLPLAAAVARRPRGPAASVSMVTWSLCVVRTAGRL